MLVPRYVCQRKGSSYIRMLSMKCFIHSFPLLVLGSDTRTTSKPASIRTESAYRRFPSLHLALPQRAYCGVSDVIFPLSDLFLYCSPLLSFLLSSCLTSFPSLLPFFHSFFHSLIQLHCFLINSIIIIKIFISFFLCYSPSHSLFSPLPNLFPSFFIPFHDTLFSKFDPYFTPPSFLLFLNSFLCSLISHIHADILSFFFFFFSSIFRLCFRFRTIILPIFDW